MRVQAIAKTELDKIKLDEVVARYVLGVRERNVRVVYLRPWDHQDGDLSIEKTNVEMVKADRRRAARRRLPPGPRDADSALPRQQSRARRSRGAGGAVDFRAAARILRLVPARRWRSAAYALTVAALSRPGCSSHHDMFARSAIALAGALLFATAAFLVLIPAFGTSARAARPARRSCAASAGRWRRPASRCSARWSSSA